MAHMLGATYDVIFLYIHRKYDIYVTNFIHDFFILM